MRQRDGPNGPRRALEQHVTTTTGALCAQDFVGFQVNGEAPAWFATLFASRQSLACLPRRSHYPPLLEFIEAVTAGLISQPVIALGDQRGQAQFAVESIEEMLPPPLVEQLRFTTLSPVTVAVTETDAQGNRRKQFLWADDPRFGPLVVANLKEKYRALTGEEPPGDLQFAFDEAYIARRGGVSKVSKL